MFENEKPKYQTKIKNLLYFTPVSCKLKINQEKEKPKHKPRKGKKLLSRLHLDLWPLIQWCSTLPKEENRLLEFN